MLTDEGRGEIHSFLSKLTTIWIIMCGILGLMVAATLFFISGKSRLMNVDESLFPMLAATLILISIADIAATFLLNNRFKSKESIGRFLSGKGATAIDISLPDIATLSDDKRGIVLLPHYFQLCLIRWAMIEVVGVYGLAMAMITGTLFTPALLYFVAALCLVYLRSSMTEFEELCCAYTEVP